MRLDLQAMALLLLTACGIRNPVRNTIIIEPDGDRRHVTVAARTEIDDASGDDEAERRRLSELRNTILDHGDLWSARFASVSAESEHIAYDKSGGVLRRAEHSARISIDDLQRFFGDLGTVQVTDEERWTELTFYPSSSTRATRQQREHVEQAMHVWATDAVRYFRALDALYAYLDRKPQRAVPALTILLDDKDEESVIEEENALLTDVKNAMTAIIDHVSEAKRNGVTLDEEFDLVFNPLPGEIVLRVPGAILALDGFERRDERTVAIPRAGLVDALKSMEGRWVSPDPLAIIALASETNSDTPDAAEIAKRPRHSSSSVTVDEVEKALADRLKPVGTYRVRWIRSSGS
jgi:hypothetical protein